MGNTMVHIVTWMGLLGIPSIFALTTRCIIMCRKYAKQLSILMQAQKAQMRSQLLKDYTFYKERGYILPIELDEWENQYKAYHQLVGANGILDARRTELFSLPNS